MTGTTNQKQSADPAVRAQLVRDELAILNETFAKEAGPATAKPSMTILVSPPRCGKGTAISTLKNQHIFPPNTSFLLSDIYTPLVDEEHIGTIHHPEKSMPQYAPAFYALRQEFFEAAIAKRDSVVLETHFRDMDKLKASIALARKQGYEVTVVGLVPPRESMMSQPKELPGYEDSRRQQRLEWAKDYATRWPEVCGLADFAALYHVKQSQDKKHSTLNLVAEQLGASQGNHLFVHDEASYAEFQGWPTANINATNIEDVFTGTATAPAAHAGGSDAWSAGLSGVPGTAEVAVAGSLSSRLAAYNHAGRGNVG